MSARPHLAYAALFLGAAFGQMPFQAGRGGGAGPAPVSNPNPDPNRSQYPGQMPDQQQMSDPLANDRNFVRHATEAGLAQVELGKLAQEKGSSAAVKDFGKRMVEEHGKANEELGQMAAKANLLPATEMSRKARKNRDKLAKLSGPEFDRAYSKMAISDHKDEVKEFEREARAGNVPEVKAFASKNLPSHQEHLKLAEQLESGNKAETSKR